MATKTTTATKPVPTEQVKTAPVKDPSRVMANRYRDEDKVVVHISPMYRPYFGKVMPIVLNGVPIYVPVDGQRYEIPRSYAMEVALRIRREDDQMKRREVLANVRGNIENYIGERDLIRPAR